MAAFQAPYVIGSRARRAVSVCTQRYARTATRLQPRRAAPRATAAGPSVGDEVMGRVTSLASYGAFVELDGGASGLLHISEMADCFVHRVEDFVRVGDEVRVLVIAEDKARGRLGLSIKQASAGGSVGYARVVELGGDWGHPWREGGWADLGPKPPPRPHPWEVDEELFRPFGERAGDGT